MSLCSSREANELQVCNKIAARREHGLSQLDHSDSESNCHRRTPLGQSLALGWCYDPRAITPSSGSQLPAGRLCQVDPSSDGLTNT